MPQNEDFKHHFSHVYGTFHLLVTHSRNVGATLNSTSPSSAASEPNRLLKMVMPTVFALTMCGSAQLLWTSMTPGALSNLFDLCFIGIWFIVFGLWFFPVVAHVWTNLSGGFRVSIRRWGVFSAVTVVATLFLIWSHFPEKIGFWLSLSSFNDAVETIDPNLARMNNDQPIRTLGIYQVDRCVMDPRGGIYFRTNTTHGLGPGECSNGFVYRPNYVGAPFGSRNYDYGHLHGDWYWFSGCSD